MLIVHRCLLGLDANWAPRVAGTLISARPVAFQPRTWRSPASGSPTGFTVRHTARRSEVRVRGAARRVLRRSPRRRIDECRVSVPCAVVRGSRAHAHRRSSRYLGIPPDASHRRSSSTSQTETRSAHLWVTACVGAACAIAQWQIVVIGVVLVLVFLVFGGPFERAIDRRWPGRPSEPSDQPPDRTRAPGP